MLKELSILRLDLERETVEARKDLIAEEEPLHVVLDSHHVVTILSSPTEKRELVLGYLLSEGLIKSIEEVEDLAVEERECRVILRRGVDVEERIRLAQPFSRVIFTSCGSPDHWPLSRLIDRLTIPRLMVGARVRAKTIQDTTKRLNSMASTFRKTGGVHVAALWTLDGDLIAMAEDVGRHNAIDKVIGSAALRGEDFSKTLISTSGRLTGDIVVKAARVGIPIVSSIAAPLASGVEVAEMTGMTLVGFVRGPRMNVYTGPDRIVWR